jgi:predicted MFS family arabinose efflux permease
MSPTFAVMTSSLRVRNYRLFASGQIISLTGAWMQTIAQDWLVLRLSHNSGTALGVVTALQFTPVLLLTLYGGVLADRLDKRKLLIGVQVGMGFLALCMGILVVSGAAQLWHVYAFAICWGIGQSLDTPTRQAFVSELVGRDNLPNAVALNSATFNSARMLGPAIGGLLIAWVDVGPAFLINAASYLAVIAALWRMDPSQLRRGEGIARQRGQVVEGLRYVRSRPDLLMVLVLVFLIGTLSMNFGLTLPLLARATFGVGAASFGLLSTAFAAGALCGALVGSRRRTRPSAGALLSFAAVFGVMELAVAFAGSFVMAAVFLVPTGAFLIAHNNAANARIQLGADPQLRGRVMALYMLVFMGGTPVGAVAVGALSQHFGARFGLALGGVSAIIAAGGLAALRAVRHRPSAAATLAASVHPS